MEFSKKLQELRKRSGFTQEELAEKLYVSRTAVSKWESGRGYPNLDSLKHISKIFDISIDDLLSGNELLVVAEQDNKRKEKSLKSLLFGVIDVSVLILWLLPIFALREGDKVSAVSLIGFNNAEIYLRVIYFVIVSLIALWGITLLVLQVLNCGALSRSKFIVSLMLSVSGLIIFIASMQTYVAILILIFLLIKGILVIKWK